MSISADQALAINRAYYDAHAEPFSKKTSHVIFDTLYKPFLSLLQEKAHILDAGCGSGRDSIAFARQGFQVTAIDASPEIVAIARARGVDAHVIPFDEIKFCDEFDAIWACASLLHVPHSQIHHTLSRFHFALRKRGILFVSLKEGSGEEVAPDGRFFSYFSSEEFSEFLLASKFEIEKKWTGSDPDSSGTIRTWLNFIARKV